MHRQLLVKAFHAATTRAGAESVLSLPAEDSGGSGRVKAPGRPILGADHASRFLLRVRPRTTALLQPRRVNINDSPGIVLSEHGRTHDAFSIEPTGDHVHAIYFIYSPDKLRHLTPPGSTTGL